jgi:hypothetical protein
MFTKTYCKERGQYMRSWLIRYKMIDLNLIFVAFASLRRAPAPLYRRVRHSGSCRPARSGTLTQVATDKTQAAGQLWLIFCVYTVIRFVWVRAKFGTCTVMRVNGTLAEDKMHRFKGVCAHFSFKKCPIYVQYNHDSASAKFSTNSHETDYSVYP